MGIIVNFLVANNINSQNSLIASIQMNFDYDCSAYPHLSKRWEYSGSCEIANNINCHNSVIGSIQMNIGHVAFNMLVDKVEFIISNLDNKIDRNENDELLLLAIQK